MRNRHGMVETLRSWKELQVVFEKAKEKSSKPEATTLKELNGNWRTIEGQLVGLKDSHH